MADPIPPLIGDAPVDTRGFAARILTQYIRDLSFENTMPPNGLSDDDQQVISVVVNIETHKLDQVKQYEVITKLAITNKLKSSGDLLFVLDIEFAGRFDVNCPDGERLDEYLSTECTRITFPFLRRIIGYVTQDGGFAPLNLETIDFATVYRKNRQQSAFAE